MKHELTRNTVNPMRANSAALSVLCALGMQANPVEAQATLPMTPDRKGAAHAVIGVSASGIPLVNITTPNHAGVSINNFKQYNVGTQGAVIVNSGTRKVSLRAWCRAILSSATGRRG
jgi:filamentous hemagglutinin